MTDGLVIAFLVAVALLAVGLGLRHGRVAPASLAASAFLGILWMLVAVAYSIDWNDADGSFDCWPRCSAIQDAMGIVLLFGPILAGILLVVALVSAIVHRLRA